ncbi:MAG: AHH domain-containing protein [Pseudomonadales bacterium]|nr:AHH domain-containing protein [Pseudomonadales bacterium]
MQVTLKHCEKNQLDIEIDRFAKLDSPTASDFDRIGTTAQVQEGIETEKLARFRRKGVKMDEEKLRTERHYSSRMALQLTRAGYSRPSQRCDAHAIVSGSHKFSAQMRAVLAWYKMRIDDHHNGCWLPADRENRKHMPQYLQKAVPHRNIHTTAYYKWLGGNINPAKIKSVEQLVKSLRDIRFRLQSGSVPAHLWS